MINLVPKLRLGTHASQVLLGTSCQSTLMSNAKRQLNRAKQSFAVAGSQAELGNQMEKKSKL